MHVTKLLHTFQAPEVSGALASASMTFEVPKGSMYRYSS